MSLGLVPPQKRPGPLLVSRCRSSVQEVDSMISNEKGKLHAHDDE
jgi:hypothetical protein